jgi:hypothetical protein
MDGGWTRERYSVISASFESSLPSAGLPDKLLLSCEVSDQTTKVLLWIKARK